MGLVVISKDSPGFGVHVSDDVLAISGIDIHVPNLNLLLPAGAQFGKRFRLRRESPRGLV